MQFQAEGRVKNADLTTVYEIIRDRLPELVPHMDNVSAIETVERRDGANGPHLLNRWRADAGCQRLGEPVLERRARETTGRQRAVARR